MEITDELLEQLSDVPVKNGRYVITDDMSPELKEICQETNAAKEERERTVLERRRIKRSMGL
jgi:hypothetical protein